MILCIDSGNTRLKWGLHDGAAWAAQGAVAHALVPTLDLPQKPDRIVACNVAGAGGEAAIVALARRHGIAAEWVRPQAAQCGVVNRYDAPEQLGADRWAALVGARALEAGACVVVMCGTATTIDVLDGEGVFWGGLILPGLDLMRAALADGTADLPTARGDYRELPRNTFDAIASGAIEATVGAVERMARRVAGRPLAAEGAPRSGGAEQRPAAVARHGPRDEPPPEGGGWTASGMRDAGLRSAAAASASTVASPQAGPLLRAPASPDYFVLLSGGAAPALAPHLALPHRLVDNLVLEGVARIAAAL